MAEIEMNGAKGEASWAARYSLLPPYYPYPISRTHNLSPIASTLYPAGLGPFMPAAIEGWIIIVTNLNEEATEEDLQDTFGEFGDIKNLSMALNRRTGYVMGYALIEYALKEEAEKAVKGTDGTTFLEKVIKTDFAFSKAPPGADKNVRGGRGRSPARR